MTHRILFAALAFLTIIPAAPTGAAALAQAAAPVAQSPLTVDEATAFTRSLTAQATAALTDQALTEAQRLTKFQGVLGENFGMSTINNFVSRDIRKKMDAAQAARFDAAFPDYITKQYARQFDAIVGRPLEVKQSVTLKNKDIVVRTQFKRQNGKPIPVDWRVRKVKSGQVKLVDIIVSGISIMSTKRAEFNGVVSDKGVETLLTNLEAGAKAPL